MKSKRTLHKPIETKSLDGTQRCSVCGAIRHSRFTYGYYPWRRNRKSEPYCKGGVS